MRGLVKGAPSSYIVASVLNLSKFMGAVPIIAEKKIDGI